MKRAVPSHSIDELVHFITSKEYEDIIRKQCYSLNEAEWNYNTNITEENAAVVVSIILRIHRSSKYN